MKTELWTDHVRNNLPRAYKAFVTVRGDFQLDGNAMSFKCRAELERDGQCLATHVTFHDQNCEFMSGSQVLKHAPMFNNGTRMEVEYVAITKSAVFQIGLCGQDPMNLGFGTSVLFPSV